MEGVSLTDIQQWTAGRVVGILEPRQAVAGISTDSRTLAPGELFLALRGPSFDGHEFVQQALNRGACGAVVERGWGEAATAAVGGPLLLVASPEETLGTIARHYRQRFDLPVIGVGGARARRPPRR